MRSGTGERGEFDALTSLRAVAALLVFLYHFPPRGHEGLVALATRQGHVGVTVFFVLSGFLITLRYQPGLARGEVRLADYFVRRAARILPLYFTVLALSTVMATGQLGGTWPEWTLTQALFGESLDRLAVPTSWSLTVEECFYALAPLVLAGTARVRRPAGGRGPILVLAAWTAGLYLVGALVGLAGPWLREARLGFLGDPGMLHTHTIFGRFFDFALGCGAGLLFLSGRVEALWRRRHGSLLATALVALGCGLGLLAQAGMSDVGGERPDSLGVWRFNLLAAVASALVVLALTCPRAPLSRLLALPALVYLGRTSYALYLIQLTPLGHGLVARLLPGGDGLRLVLLYGVMCAISALLYELVEEPARETVLWLWRRRAGGSAPRPSLARAAVLGSVVAALSLQQTTWALEELEDRIGPLDEADVVEVLGPGSPDLVRVQVIPAAGEPRVPMPESWRIGRPGEQRAPASLLVFVDGEPVPFTGAREPGDAVGDVFGYYRKPRSEHLSLRLPGPAEVAIVNNRPSVALALALSRLAAAPRELPSVLLLFAASLAAAWCVRGLRPVWPARSGLLLGVAMAGGWLLLDLSGQPWAPAVIGLELLGLLLLGWRASLAPPRHLQGR